MLKLKVRTDYRNRGFSRKQSIESKAMTGISHVTCYKIHSLSIKNSEHEQAMGSS